MEYKGKELGFIPSEYQKKVIDFVLHGQGNGIISATAGSGKTTTLVSLMKYISPLQKCLFVAFNKSIVEKLSTDLQMFDNVIVKTSHGLGFDMLTKNYGKDITVNEFKYSKYLRENINNLTTNKSISDFYLHNIIQLIHLSRFYLAQSIKEIQKIADKYSIVLVQDECEVVQKCLKWGRQNMSVVDYTDLLWLPTENSLRPIKSQFDWIIIDECQDLSLASIKLIQKCIKRGTRIISCGDINQQIYTFSGASDDAFETLKNLPHTTEFSLPISYRCAKSIVKLANVLVPDMQCSINAEEGNVTYNTDLSVIKKGDMVLARNKLPLLMLYKKLIKNNINAYIKKSDSDTDFEYLLSNIDKNTPLSVYLDSDGVFPYLFRLLFDGVYKLMADFKMSKQEALIHKSIVELYDNIQCLATLSENCSDLNCLLIKIKELFTQTENAVCLSTIHKAKGLECDNVHIICHSSIPSILAKAEWELKQERNLLYVAYTRAKNNLTFISEDIIPNIYTPNKQKEYIQYMSLIEKRLKQLNLNPIAEHIVKKRFHLNNSNVVTFNNKQSNDDSTILTDLLD